MPRRPSMSPSRTASTYRLRAAAGWVVVMVGFLLADGKACVATDAALTQAGKGGGGGVPPVGHAANLGVRSPGGDQAHQNGEVLAV
jgi:hypothetical protein